MLCLLYYVRQRNRLVYYLKLVHTHTYKIVLTYLYLLVYLLNFIEAQCLKENLRPNYIDHIGDVWTGMYCMSRLTYARNVASGGL